MGRRDLRACVAEKGAVMVEASDEHQRPERKTMEARRDLAGRTPLIISTTSPSSATNPTGPSLMIKVEHAAVLASGREGMVARTHLLRRWDCHCDRSWNDGRGPGGEGRGASRARRADAQGLVVKEEQIPDELVNVGTHVEKLGSS
jgi:hypothetical protein